MPKQVRVRGHTLIAEGKPFTKWGDQIFPEVGLRTRPTSRVVPGVHAGSCLTPSRQTEPVSVGTTAHKQAGHR